MKPIVFSFFSFISKIILDCAEVSFSRSARISACPMLLLALLMLSGFLCGCGGGAGSSGAPDMSVLQTEFWISPDGNDSSPGTQSSPFLTMERARDAIRSLDKERREGEIVVYLKGGTYRLSQPLVLGPEDSGQNGREVIYCAAPGEKPVISGSVSVGNWSLHDKDLGIYRAQVGQRETRQLYVNGQRAVRARTSLYPSGFCPAYFYIFDIPDPLGILYIPTDLNDARWKDPSKWTNPQHVEAVIVSQWKMMRVPVESVTPYPEYVPDPLLQPDLKTGLLKIREPAWTNANIYLSSVTYEPGLWSFWQVTWFENAYEFLDEPGEWYLDKAAGSLYYIPRSGESMESVSAELPVLEVLVKGEGQLSNPISNIRFEGLTFTGATWLSPSGINGYVADQSGFFLVGTGHKTNITGHDPDVVRTPGNLQFRYASGISFRRNLFMHLGSAGLDFEPGCEGCTVQDNLFMDISSAAVQLGGVTATDAHPGSQEQVTRNNTISNNLIRQAGTEYVDAAGIMVGFTANTLISNNTIIDVPWSGIAMGWGWGLYDPGMFPGISNAQRGEWGTYTTPTPNSGNRILNNRIEQFLMTVWDGGAIYTTGQQGTSMDDPLLVKGNVANAKRPTGGGNIFYTDGGSRYVVLQENVSYDNPQGVTDFGPPSKEGDPLPYPAYSEIDNIPYGGDIGGCRTYGDITFTGNYWGSDSYFSVCPFTENGISYPVNMTFSGTHIISGSGGVPQSVLDGAGVQNFPQALLDAAGLQSIYSRGTRLRRRTGGAVERVEKKIFLERGVPCRKKENKAAGKN
ncbi:MAG: right-handed parallel beta-helix repeat-containing protein [Candidatus Eremiobacteraeota bacterium]|nr:right-handed parallel beta-helix repeat-containing protein [Candidatus Eremiobacteraeota bacterium]